MIRRIAYILGLMLVLFSCSSEVEELNKPAKGDGKRITVHFKADTGDYRVVTRATNDDSQIKTLQLWVFDKNGLFVDASDAVFNKPADGSKETPFTASIPQLNDKYIIHFVANHDIDATTIENWKGKSENEVVAQTEVELTGDQPEFVFWSRQEYPSLVENGNLGKITFIHNVAKFTLTVPATLELKDVHFKLVNIPNKGTIAPFDPEKGEFLLPKGGNSDGNGIYNMENDNPTNPNNTIPQDNYYDRILALPPQDVKTVKNLGEDKLRKATIEDGTNPLVYNAVYSYECNNTDENIPDDGHIVMIVKGKYEGKTSYYKMEFVRPNRDDVRYNIYRNNWYDIHISHVFGEGYPTEEAALEGIAANAYQLSSKIYVYRNFSMGRGELEVERTYYFFTPEMMKELENNTFTVQANYYKNPSVNSTSNDLIRIASPNNIGTPGITGDVVNTQNTKMSEVASELGQLIVQLNDFKDNNKPSEISLEVNEDPVKDETGLLTNPYLKRKIRVETHNKFNYANVAANETSAPGNEVTVTPFPKEAGHPLAVQLTFPKELNERMLPLKLDLNVKDFHFYYKWEDSQDFGRLDSKYKEGDGMHYYLLLTKMPANRTVTLNFVSNTAENADEITVDCSIEYLPGKWGEVMSPGTIKINN